MDLAESLIRALFQRGGISVGSSPAADIRVTDRRFFTSVLRRGSLGLGESYMQRWWECDQIDELFRRIKTSGLDRWSRINPAGVVARLRHRFAPGCGWGSFAAFAAKRYGARVTGITVSREQAGLARQRCRGLAVDIQLMDYRALDKSFDHIVSIGMFEHIQPANYRGFFATMARCLKSGEIFLLHTIGADRLAFDTDPWLRKYVFPLGMIPVPSQVRAPARRHFHLLDWHALGSHHYDRTLMAWHANFTAHWQELAPAYASKLQGGFARMWSYYLLSCAGVFRARGLDVWQIAMAREALPYQPSR